MPEIPTGQFTTHSAEETFELAYGIGEALDRATVFLLQGDLGAGKTVFAKGIAAGLDIDPVEVNSPTFTLVNAHQGRLKLHHLDLYRLAGHAAEVFELGLSELLGEPDTVVLIEWPERLVLHQAENEGCRAGFNPALHPGCALSIHHLQLDGVLGSFPIQDAYQVRIEEGGEDVRQISVQPLNPATVHE
ncbi:MAG: tRNA (adenosine(37)-N6)-threonylcarbamoyltransferase complex ATPase subunit type 1 TsaE [Acidobacteria bacterium]|nr:tRNA (adenosine(37)-N6)-threonylcarbamoyltransferase complex ATPase subunit type 1 TsaE [Acidobacteriota bacterium]MBI3421955.1 tRNA (adenosine(37)-N6)-threonylcarbamoyltransferase complex ATPase subunit type 1 TsaE [Acidobacteriota bacterium]